jgi:uncharacterized protein (TIRG00374 family)
MVSLDVFDRGLFLYRGARDFGHLGFMKILRLVGVVIGLTIVGLLIHKIGWTSIRHTLGWLGWGYAVVLLYPLSWMLMNTTSWRTVLPIEHARFPIWRLLGIRMAGDSFNSLLPSGYVGGEPLKAKMLSKWMPLRDATSSVLVAKSAQSISLVIFVGLGLAIGHTPGTSLLAQPGLLIALAVLTIGISIFTFLLASRSFSLVGHWLHRWTGHRWLQSLEPHLLALDASVGRFYREDKKDFVISVLWSLGAWLSGATEVAIIFFMIGHAIDWRQAWFMGALAQLASIIGLFVPAGVGFYESGHFIAARLLGLPPDMAVGVSLIRRVREVFWDGMGVVLFGRLAGSTKS